MDKYDTYNFIVELLGKELARQFVELGAKVIISARNVADLEKVKAELLGKDVWYVVRHLNG